ncbi:MAG: hypothetical protein HC906_01015 [Bacteroidales bacterium]|nr:hypothetical protein [Bacteroidales bacterium]
MKKTILYFFTLFSFVIYAQEPDSVKKVLPFQFTFVTPLGTNGTESYKIINEFSMNALLGINGGVDGFEFGGFINIDQGDVKGGQIAGFSNGGFGKC